MDEVFHEFCSTPSFPFIGSFRLIYIISCMAVTIASALLQIIFVLVCQKMKGWKSDFAFYLLQIMAFFSLLKYVGSFASYIHALILFESRAFAKAIGSNHLGSVLAFFVANLFLTIHRFFYTLFPLKAQRILTTRIEKIGIALIFILYGTFVAITMSPLVSYEFCAADFFFYVVETPLLPLILWTSQICNYSNGFVGVIAYGIMFTTLYIKGSLTFKRNKEIRMTAQVAVVSIFELLFFALFEFGGSALESASWFWCLDDYLMLIRYDVLILPYMIFNKSVRDGMKDLFRKKKSTTPFMVSMKCPQVSQRSIMSSGQICRPSLHRRS